MVNLTKLREINFRLTKKSLKENTKRDILIIQTIHSIEELLMIINKLSANLRERYSYYALYLCKNEDINVIIDGIIKKVKEDDMAIEMNDDDLDSIIDIGKEIKDFLKSSYAKEIKNVIALKESQEKYLEKIMKELCPRTLECATALIGARLIDRAGSLKRLAELPSSTIQVLGAEKALFRHIKTGAKSPKFGVIFAHPKVSEVFGKEKGKAARHVASEISKMVKIDYFSKKANN